MPIYPPQPESSALVRQRAPKEKSMKKSPIARDDDVMLPEYDFSNGVRNKYAKEFGRSPSIRILAPDLLEVFPDSESVNEALHALVRISAAAAIPPQKISASTASAPKSKPKKRKARP